MLGCPIVKKRKLEEAEENQSAPKKRNQPGKQAAGEDFTADNDTTDEDEEEEEGEEEGEEEDDREKKKDMAKIRAEATKGERAFSPGGEGGDDQELIFIHLLNLQEKVHQQELQQTQVRAAKARE